MMKLQEIIKLPEGRRLEFKQKLPASADLAKTIVAFANDAGGDLYIGVQNHPRKLTGIPESELLKTEEKIASLIHDNCAPVIVPDITFPVENGCYLIRVQIHRGSDFPYHLKSKGIHGGTYIRIGSTNRLADDSIIAELQRRKRNISFDSEPLHGNAILDFDLIGKEIAGIFGLSWAQVGTKPGPGRDQAGTKLALSWNQVQSMLAFSQTSRNVKELMTLLNWKNRTKFRTKYINPLLGMGLLLMTIPNKPSSPNQQYFLTEKGHRFLEFLKKKLNM